MAKPCRIRPCEPKDAGCATRADRGASGAACRGPRPSPAPAPAPRFAEVDVDTVTG